MKKIMISVLSILLLSSCAGYTYLTEQKGTYEKIDETNLTKAEAYNKVKEWLATNFNSANDVLQLQDEENGKLIGQAIGSYYYDILRTQKTNFRYTLTIQVKDNKIKYTFLTRTIVNSEYPPYEKDLPDILEIYKSIRVRINEYLATKTNDDF